jgi:2-polyprenyl-3-methyl-5-hydroxy-6-metoxy-1,4-benzoquinol methylase
MQLRRILTSAPAVELDDQSMKQETDRKTYRQRIYERYARDFQDAPEQFNEADSRKWGKAYRYYLRDWLPKNKAASIVDVACGRGLLLHFFRERGYTALAGVDISPTQTLLATQVIPQVLQEDAIVFLETAHDRFDLVIGLDIIEHFHKPEVLEFLDAANAALKSGGRIVLQLPNAESPWGTMHRYNDFTHETGFTPNALTRLLRLSGFVDVESREVGPVPFGYSAVSTIRFVIWRAVRAGLKIWNLAEIGNTGSGVFTRVFLVSAIKK